ncbi:amidohydrolase family protein [Sphingobium lactosutens]|uniref:Amidohydrolase-related domain-containing protein n=1 Tax=Sphingobium lactosutens DS20 TaxID=1331060 RepID=T0IM58_9SPHN|nr:amidohydrolase family protein [Sphingobium lactosutens]EQB12830.1 hypothetical protein RLDS_18825 [Sphingobium lactosutens DS20]
MRIDAHHHLWQYDPCAYGWIEPGSAIARNFGMADFGKAMEDARVDACIAVQARQSCAETEWLLGLAATHPAILGVVGWVDLRADDIDIQLHRQSNPSLVGYRYVVQDESDPDFLLGHRFIRGVRAVVERGLAYDVLVNHEQLASIPQFLDQAGSGRWILDHAAKPAIKIGGWQPWAAHIADIARYPNIWCKISGLVTEADHQRWDSSDFERYLDHVMAHFGPDRLIWGSDWPVCLLAASYRLVHDLIADYVARHCPGSEEAIFGKNAVTAYALDIGPR